LVDQFVNVEYGGDGKGAPPLKQCSHCSLWVPVATKQCKGVGYTTAKRNEIKAAANEAARQKAKGEKSKLGRPCNSREFAINTTTPGVSTGDIDSDSDPDLGADLGADLGVDLGAELGVDPPGKDPCPLCLRPLAPRDAHEVRARFSEYMAHFYGDSGPRPANAFEVVKTTHLDHKLGHLVSLHVVRGGKNWVRDFDRGGDQPSAIVNAANPECVGGGGMDGAVAAAGGAALLEARELLPTGLDGRTRCETGDAVITVGGQLKTTHCIHAVGPDYRQLTALGSPETYDTLLRNAYEKSLQLAEHESIATLVFPLLSSGVYRGNCPLVELARIAVATTKERLELSDYLRDVYLVGYDDTQVAALLEAVAEETKA